MSNNTKITMHARAREHQISITPIEPVKYLKSCGVLFKPNFLIWAHYTIKLDDVNVNVGSKFHTKTERKDQ